MKINRMAYKIVSGLLILTLLHSNAVFAEEKEAVVDVNDDVISGASVDMQTTSAYAASTEGSIYPCNNGCYIDFETGVITGFNFWYISTGTEAYISSGTENYYGDSKYFDVAVVPTAIGDNAVKNNSSYLRYIELSDSITSIGRKAFADCKSLDAIVIPDSVTYIADDAFSGCNFNMTVFCKKGSYADNFDFYPDGVKINYGIPALSNAEASGEPSVAANTVIKKDNEIHSLKITPMMEVKTGSEIYVKINNGSFDESLMDECAFKSNDTGATWEFLEPYYGGWSSDQVIIGYIQNEGSRQLPYKLEYIDSSTLKVTLSPLRGRYAYRQSSEITRGVPIYNIKLPAVSGSIKGRITVSIDGNGTSIDSHDNIVYAYNDGFTETEYSKLSTHYVERELSVAANKPILYNNQPNAVYIKPTFEILNNAYIYIKIRNGSFNEEILKNCEFRTNFSRLTYDQLIEEYNKNGDVRIILERYIGCEGSRQLPYKLEFVDSQTIKVWLYPIDNRYNNNDTYGTPLYKIPIPAVSGNENGYTQIAIDSGNSSINSGGWYTIARINSAADYESEYKWNSYFTIENQVKVDSGSSILYNENPLALKVKPLTGIGKEESILINIDNGYFDKNLFDSCEFKTKYSETTYDMLLKHLNVQTPLEDILKQYIKKQNSNQLPYKLEYVDRDTIKVWLFPIDDEDVGEANTVTTTNPVYNILLPAVAGEYNGDITIAVDGNGSSIQTSGWYKLGTVENGLDVVIGDLDGDNKSTVADSLIVARLAIGKAQNDELYSLCDYDNDGRVTVNDALILARYALGKISSL